MAVRNTRRTSKKVAPSVESEWVEPSSVVENSTESRMKLNYGWITLGVIVLLVLGFWFKTKTWPVVAMVNGLPITRYEVDQKLWAQDAGQTLQGLVLQRLIDQEIKKSNVTVNDSDVTKKIDAIKASLGPGQDLNTLLAARGTSQTEFKKQVGMQLSVEKLLGDKLKVTDTEVTQYIKDNAASFPASASEEAKMAQAKTALADQKFQTAFTAWLDQIKKNAKIWELGGTPVPAVAPTAVGQ